MGWSAIVETDFGDRYTLIQSGGVIGGKALFSFLAIVDSKCSHGHNADGAVAKWIIKFNEVSEHDFCETSAKLINAYYGGDWEYEDDQYNVFLLRNPGFEITEASFKRTLEEIREKWTEVNEIIEAVQALIVEFNKGYLEQTEWYVEPDTISDFEGLLQTLVLAKQRQAKKVRIRID